MYNYSDFFIALQKYVNENDILNLYFDSAKKTAPFPYGVISDPVNSKLRYGTLVYFDINIWSSEPETGPELERKIENLINKLDGLIFKEQRAVVHFETQKDVDDPEFELIRKKITFSARIF